MNTCLIPRIYEGTIIIIKSVCASRATAREMCMNNPYVYVPGHFSIISEFPHVREYFFELWDYSVSLTSAKIRSLLAV